MAEKFSVMQYENKLENRAKNSGIFRKACTERENRTKSFSLSGWRSLLLQQAIVSIPKKQLLSYICRSWTVSPEHEDATMAEKEPLLPRDTCCQRGSGTLKPARSSGVKTLRRMRMGLYEVNYQRICSG